MIVQSINAEHLFSLLLPGLNLLVHQLQLPEFVRWRGLKPWRRGELPGGSEASRAPGQNLISPACPSPVPSPPVLAHLHSESVATILPRALSLREHKTPFPSLVTDRLTDQVN